MGLIVPAIDFENITVIYITVISSYYLFHLNFHYNHIGLGGDCNDGPFKGCNSKLCTTDGAAEPKKSYILHFSKPYDQLIKPKLKM